MGFSVASTHMLFFIGVIAISAGVIVSFNAFIDETRGAMTDKKTFITDQLRTQIEVINVRYSGGISYIYAKNIGDRLMNTNCLNVFVDGMYITDANLDILNASSGTPRTEWNLEETLEFQATHAISGGTHTAKVVTCNGISDEYSFST
ncbi:hypothetical protein ACFLRF_05960 [Candidatus Altiarchaeota archaeon]